MEDEGRNYKLRLGLPEITQPYLGNWLGPGDGSFSLTNLADSNHTFDQPTHGAWLSADDNVINSSRSLDAEALHKIFPTNSTRPTTQESNFSDISVANDVKSNASTAKFSASGWGLAVTGSHTSSAGSLTQRFANFIMSFVLCHNVCKLEEIA